ncbi:MAG TPA: GWxTD domain-containing protein [Longimicrobiales bacterium]
MSRPEVPCEGHLTGGPSRWSRLAALVSVVAAACSGVGPSHDPTPAETGVLEPLQVYRQLGMLAGPERFPAVASFATMAGPSDSTYVLFGLSLPNSALRFQREGPAFVGRYTVSLKFAQDSQQVREVGGEQVVRVPTFAETSRTDESVVYQTAVALVPGEYVVTVEARDGSGGQGFEARDTLVVPAFGTGKPALSAPMLVYRAEARSSEDTTPELIVNPRHTIAYGGDAPRLYIEGYGYPVGRSVQVRVLDDAEEEVWRTEAVLEGADGEMRHAIVEIPTSTLPLGRLWVETMVPGDSAAAQRVPLVVTISDQWMVANFEEMLEFLEYIAYDDELDSLRNATPEERAALWDNFWERRDPIPASPINEFREQFFERIRTATLYFEEAGTPGWKTDRGEVFIVLGPPDQVFQRDFRRMASARPAIYEWLYDRLPGGRVVLTFVDRYEFGRYELTPPSRSAFRAAAARVRPDN